MARQIVGLEWNIGEEAFAGGYRSGREAYLPKPGMSQRSELGIVLEFGRWLLCFAVACLLAGSTAVSQDEQALRDAYSSIYAWMDASERAWRLDDRDGYTALIDPTIPGDWKREWQSVWGANSTEREAFGLQLNELTFDGGIARAEFVSTRPSSEWWLSSPYRESRFFRFGEQGPLRTIPPPAFWGEPMSLETDHVRLEFNQRDQQLAHSILDELESSYLALHRIMELDPDADPTKAIILLDVDLPRRWESVRKYQRLPSPHLSRIPVGLSDRDYIMQRVVGRFSYMVLNDSIIDDRRSYLSQWETVVWALDGWLRTDVLQQRTPWHLQAEELLRLEPPAERPISLAGIGPWQSRGIPEQKAMMRQYMLAESVIAYLVEEHGHEQLPRILSAITRHTNWADVIMALYGLPLGAVEADWNIYLADRFNWEPIHSSAPNGQESE